MKSLFFCFRRYTLAVGLFLGLVSPLAAQRLTFDQASECGVALTPTSYSFTTALATDAQSNVFVAGYFDGSIQFGSLVLTGRYDAFVAKRDAGGTWLWATSAGGAEGDGCTALALDGQGQVYVTGYFGNGSPVRPTTPATATFGAFTLASAGDADAFVAKLDGATGTWLWAQRAGFGNANSCNERGRMLVTDALGGVLVLGSSSGPFILIGPTTLTTPGFFLARLDAATGTWGWAQSLSGNSIVALAGDGLGGGYLCGRFTALPPLVFAAPRGTHVVRFDAAGVWQWAAAAEGTAGTGSFPNGFGGTDCLALAVAPGDPDHVYVSGAIGGATATFGATVLTNTSVTYQGPALGTIQLSDAFVARLNAGTGTWQWARRAGGPDSEYFSKVAVRGGRVVASGTFGRSLSTGVPSAGGSTFGPSTLMSLGKIDMVVAALDTAGTWLGAVGAGTVEDDDAPIGLAIDAASRTYLTGRLYGRATQFGSLSIMASGGTTSNNYLARLAAVPLTASPVASRSPFAVYPSPARLAVTVAGLPPHQPLVLYDALGRLVVSAQMPAQGPLLLPLPAALPPGLYLVQSAGQVRRLLVE